MGEWRLQEDQARVVRIGKAKKAGAKTKKAKGKKSAGKASKTKPKSKLSKKTTAAAKRIARAKEAPKVSPAPGASDVRSWAVGTHLYAGNGEAALKKNMGAYKALGLNEDEATYAATVVERWALDIFAPAAASMRGTVAAVIGRDFDDEARALFHGVKAQELKASTFEKALKAARSSYEGESPPSQSTARSALAKVAKASQDAYDEDPVTLYRGVNPDSAQNAKQSGRLAVGALSSWTESQDVARSFTEISNKTSSKPSKKKIYKGAVMKITVPRSAIMLSHRTCPGLLDSEQEVVLASKGAVKCEIVEMHESKNEGKLHEVDFEGVALRVPNEPLEGAADGYDDWMASGRGKDSDA